MNSQCRRPGLDSLWRCIARMSACSVVAALLLGFSGAARAQEVVLSARDVAALIDEWAAVPGPVPERAARIVALMGEQDAARSLGPLRDAARVDGKRPAVASLCAKIRHPKAWEILGKHTATQDFDVVADALFACGGEVVEREMRTRWAAEPSDSTLGIYLTDKFARVRLNADSIAFFVGRINDEKLGRAARNVATAALRLSPDAGDAEIRDACSALQKLAKLYSREWVTRGVEVALQGGDQWGRNRQFGAEANFHSPVPGWAQSASHSVTIRFIPLVGDACEIGYGSTQGTWSVLMRAGKGLVMAGDKVEYPTAAMMGRWCEMKLDIKVRDVPGQIEKERDITITVEGKVLPGWFALNGDIKGIYIRGASVVGGCELVRL